MSSKGTKRVVCVTFEPQLFRKNLCKNCFKTRDDHNQTQTPEATENKEAPKKQVKLEEKSKNDSSQKSNDTKDTKTHIEPPASPAGQKKPSCTSKTSVSVSLAPVKVAGTGIGHTENPPTIYTTVNSTEIKPSNETHNHTSSGQGADVGKVKADPTQEVSQAKISESDSVQPHQQHSTQGVNDVTQQSQGNAVVFAEGESSLVVTPVVTPDTPSSEPVTVVQPPRTPSPPSVTTVSGPQNNCHSRNTSVESSSPTSDSGSGQSTQYNTSVWLSSNQQQQQQVIDTDTEAELAKLKRGHSKSAAQEALTIDDIENEQGDWYISHHAPQTPATTANYTTNTTNTTNTNNATPDRNIYLIRSRSLSQDDSNSNIPPTHRRTRARCRMDRRNSFDDVGRSEAMMEGHRMLMDNLRDKISILDDKCERLEREKKALADLMVVRKDERVEKEERLRNKIDKLDDMCTKLEEENVRLQNILKLPEGERKKLRDQDDEMHEVRVKLEDTEGRCVDLLDDNLGLRQEIKDLHLEMEEMHDQFREEEALEFREIQKDLEATAKNCRILQFKLRKSERRNDQLEAEKMAYEEKNRQLEERHDSSGGNPQHTRELEEELRMAKEVSVRLHDELEIVEERRARYEEELERVQDYLHESENRRSTLQREKNALHQELEDLRDEITQFKNGGTTLKVPEQRKPKLTKEGSRENSVDYDIEQLQRDLQASHEREDDVKEQLKFAQEENKVSRKKLSELEDENESLNMQLEKSAGGKYFIPKTGSEKESATEKEQNLKMELDLAEDELKVLRRKLDEAEQENENLRIDIKVLESTMGDKRDKQNMKNWDKSHEEKFTAMSKDIEELKWKLIEKDREVESLKTSGKKKGTLKKSKSLEEDTEDLTKKLSVSMEEVSTLKDTLTKLEHDKDRLAKENKKLKMMPGAKIPSITTDDAAVQNIDLKDKLKLLETENELLRTKVNTLDEKLDKLSKEVTQARSRGSFQEESNEARDLREQLAHLEDECRQLRKRVTELETENNRLTRELNKYKKPDIQKAKKDKANLANATREELRNKVTELEDELSDLSSVIRSRENENVHMEKDIQTYRGDLEKIRKTFQQREKELLDELEGTQQKNDILSNLLDLVTERAESTQRELEKFVGDDSRPRSERITSDVSNISDVSTGSDEVFAHKEDSTEKRKPMTPNWEEQFLKRIECLERLLAEERQKVQAAEKKMEVKDCAKSSALTDDAKLHQREKNLIQQELVTCQKQLTTTKEELKEVKEKLEKMSQEKDKGSKTNKPSMPVREPASWKWEKQEMERQIKDLKKKVEDLQKPPLVRKSSLVSDDKQKTDVSSTKELKQLKDENKKLKKDLEDAKKSQTQAEEGLTKKEKQWNKEKDKLETSNSSLEKDIKKLDDVTKQRDDVVKAKEKLAKEKTESLKAKDEELKKANSSVEKMKKELDRKEEECKNIKDSAKQRDKDVRDMESKVKKLDETVRVRDDRIKEKDDIMDGLNKKMKEKDNKILEMDKNCSKLTKDATKHTNKIKDIEKKSTDSENDIKALKIKTSELEVKMEKAEQEHSKELSATVIAREKLESQLAQCTQECKEAQDKAKTVREKLQTKDKDRQKEVGKLELQLKQANEKIHSLEMSKTMKKGDAVQALTKEKEQLITEKHKASDDLKKLRNELQDSTKAWNTERDEMRTIITKKKKVPTATLR